MISGRANQMRIDGPPADQLGAEPPLLRALGVRFVGRSGRTVEGAEEILIRGRSLVLLGDAGELLECLLDPGRLERGTLSLLGRTPSEALSDSEAAIAPRFLPVPPSLSLKDALGLSARLVGEGKRAVETVLSTVQLTALSRRKVGELTGLQMRLAGLAHALLANPRLLLLDDPYRGLDAAGAEMLELLIEAELEKRSWIACLSDDSPRARRLLLSAQQVLSAELGKLVGPLPPSHLGTQTYWAKFRKVSAELTAELARGASEVIATPHAQVLLLRGIPGKQIARAGMVTQCDLLELRPVGPLTPSDRD